MCARLLELRQALEAMAAAKAMPSAKAIPLTEFQWTVITLAERLLRPFMEVQKELEGESYITVSYIPFLLARLRAGLEVAAQEQGRLLESVGRGFARMDISIEAQEAEEAAEAAQTMLALALGMGIELAGEDDTVAPTLPSVDPSVLKEAELTIRETAKLMLCNFNKRFGSGTEVSRRGTC
jgi:hypothetical protein